MSDEASSTRDRLLAAAERLFLSKDPDQVSVRAVNAEAGLNPGAVHYHFGSREGLIAALLERELVPVWADRLAPVILYRAGFDPRVYLSYLQLLKKLEASRSESFAKMASLHPPVSERIEWVKSALLQIPPRKDASVSSASFAQIKSILQQTAEKGAKRQDVQ